MTRKGRRFRAWLSMILVLAACCPCLAQSDKDGSAVLDAHQMVESALAQLKAGDLAKTRFTRFELMHLTNRDKKGKLTIETNELYEDLWINGLAYKRLVERDGEPLTGNELEKEQERYDAAVRERSALDTKARSKIEHRIAHALNLQIMEAGGPNYRVSELGRERVDGKAVRVLLAEPAGTDSSGKAMLMQRFKFWMSDDGSPVLLRMEFEFLDDEPEYLRGTRGTTEYQMFDSVVVFRRSVTHGYTPHGKKVVTVDSDTTFSRYRRFTTSVTVLPASGEPDVPQERTH